MLAMCQVSFAQKGNKQIAQGNKLYQAGKYKQAAAAYENALKIVPNNQTAKYNLANALEKQKQEEKASEIYQQLAKKGNKNIQANSYYNDGVADVKSKKLKEAIEAFKNTLRRAPNDQEARENLQKALNEQKQNQKQNQQNKNQNKPNQPKNDPQKKPQESPKEQQNKKQMDQLLNQLRDQEKDLQKKLQKQNQQTKQPEKDW